MVLFTKLLTLNADTCTDRAILSMVLFTKLLTGTLTDPSHVSILSMVLFTKLLTLMQKSLLTKRDFKYGSFY